MELTKELKVKIAEVLTRGREDWPYFARTVFGVYLDDEQEAILRSVQVNKMTTVASGTARGKDFITAVAALCFLYLTPSFNRKGELVGNTKVALTAPTDRQVKNIMMPEIARLYRRMRARGFGFLGGELNSYDLKTDNEEWFLTGFKADEHNHEAWSGFHAVNTMFAITEATGIPDDVFGAIEGNLQGNSRILIVFNPNVNTGYAAKSQKSKRWNKFRLSSLNAPNVVQKQQIIPGQVDYEWIADKVEEWCHPIADSDYNEEGDFRWEGRLYRPSDIFRIKVLGLFPKESADTLIPGYWVDLAVERWKVFKQQGFKVATGLKLGVDVAGMGRDSSAFVPRYGDLVDTITMVHSGGKANHMEIAGRTKVILQQATDAYVGKKAQAFIDTIGEGAGVYSRLDEQGQKGVFSVKFSEGAKDENANDLTDVTEQYTFANMRAYLFWAVRDWLDPSKNSQAMLPPDDELKAELTEIKWKFQSSGKIIIEPKEDIKKRLGKSPDKSDALANTFYPVPVEVVQRDLSGIFA